MIKKFLVLFVIAALIILIVLIFDGSKTNYDVATLELQDKLDALTIRYNLLKDDFDELKIKSDQIAILNKIITTLQ